MPDNSLEYLGPVPELADRLGYLFKHAHARLTDLTSAALAPLGVSGRQLAVLLVIAEQPSGSQLGIATRMGLDRTTMVTLIDDLERAGLVQRSPDPADRRRNVVDLTTQGRKTTRQGAALSEQAEKSFLEPLSKDDTAMLRRALRLLAFPSSFNTRSEAQR
jgi:DNA-binding MarR family transcriptional regulator